AFIEPELREGRGELERALAKELPVLVTDGDLQGILHAHTDASDGVHDLGQMADATRKRGYAYLGIADHSRSAAYAGGLSIEEIERVLAACAKHGVAVEINANPWRLDLDWRWHARALELGCTMSINPDAHSISEIDLTHWGVEMARKGGVPKQRVLNCLGLREIGNLFAERSSGKFSGPAAPARRRIAASHRRGRQKPVISRPKRPRRVPAHRDLKVERT